MPSPRRAPERGRAPGQKRSVAARPTPEPQGSAVGRSGTDGHEERAGRRCHGARRCVPRGSRDRTCHDVGQVVDVPLHAPDADEGREGEGGNPELGPVVVVGDRGPGKGVGRVSRGKRQLVGAVGALALGRVLDGGRVQGADEKDLADVVGGVAEALVMGGHASRGVQRRGYRRQDDRLALRIGEVAPPLGLALSSSEIPLHVVVERNCHGGGAGNDGKGHEVVAGEHSDDVAAEVRDEPVGRPPHVDRGGGGGPFGLGRRRGRSRCWSLILRLPTKSHGGGGGERRQDSKERDRTQGFEASSHGRERPANL